VVLVAPGWHDDSPGGASRLPSDFARFLSARGHHVTYVCPSGAVARIESAIVDGVDLRRYPAPSAASPSVQNARQHWQLSRQIADDVRRSSPVRAVLGHTPLQYLAMSGRFDADTRRCYGVHSPFEAELREGVGGTPTVRQRIAWRGAAWIEDRLLDSSDLVHYDSAFTRSFMEARYPQATYGKGMVLPGWVDDVRFRPSHTPRNGLRQRLGAPWISGIPTFFTLRRLVPRMGLDTLIAASVLLARRGREFRVVIGGDGPERVALEAQTAAAGVRDRVAFVGRIREADLVDSFCAADCFVLPTRALECFGLIVLESYACGVPVVGVPVGSISEVMGPDLRAWIATDNRAAAIAERMDDVLSGRLTANPDALRDRAAQFSMAAVAERHERVLLGGSPQEADHADR
jgi:glycosyltransferase involved in cell wall biosynthesis